MAEAVQIVDTPRGHQYNVTYREEFPGTDLYEVAIEEHGIFVAGRRRAEHWTAQLRFPDRDAFGAFRERCEEVAVDPTIQAIHERSAAARAQRYDISDPQREILLLAARRGYFEVPRCVSLADLADELDVSSQAASE